MDASAGMPATGPAWVEPSPPRRPSACGELSGMNRDFGAMVPTPVVNPRNEPNPAPRFFVDMSHKELDKLRKQRGFS